PRPAGRAVPAQARLWPRLARGSGDPRPARLGADAGVRTAQRVHVYRGRADAGRAVRARPWRASPDDALRRRDFVLRGGSARRLPGRDVAPVTQPESTAASRVARNAR